ncbi:MAG: TIM-barrel domain-containing protein, partial [Bacteroidota bacterium]
MTRRLLTVLFLCAATTLTGWAEWQSAGKVRGHRMARSGDLLIETENLALTITVLAEDLFRMRYVPHGRSGGDSSWAVLTQEWAPVRTRLMDSAGVVFLETEQVTLAVHKNPLRLVFRDPAGGVITSDHGTKGMSWSGGETRVWKKMPEDEYYYGFGEQAGRFERKRTHMTMWNSDIPAYGPDTDPLYKSIPFFFGIAAGKAYGIFLDSPRWSSFDMGKEAHDQYSFGTQDSVLTYYFLYGPAPEKILERFTQLVGRMPLPPLWSLGYQQCRWSYASEKRAREIADGFRQRNIPCDVIYLDIDYMDGYRIFTWHPDNFPEPSKLVKDLADDGFKVAVILDPGIKVDSSYHAYVSGVEAEVFVTEPDGSLFVGEVWPGRCAFPDFTDPSARLWWGEQFADLVRTGIRGWWNDMNEPSVFNVPTKTIDLDAIHHGHGIPSSHAANHNVYGMQMTRATYDGALAHRPDERPFVLTRATFAGGQRFSAVWTGDNVATWEHMSMGLSMCLNLSISGFSFVGTDIGGFIGYPTGELFARWLQLGVFTPLMRAHSVINERDKEPWEFGDEYTEINRKTIQLRYRLLPYIYNAMRVSTTSGIPAMRPMVFAYPEDSRFRLESRQFMFGDGLLVAPVLSPGARERNVELPAGLWYDFWTGEKHKGGNAISVPAPLDRIPLLARAGATIPTRQPVQYSDQSPINPLTIHVFLKYSGADSMEYYEDDG